MRATDCIDELRRLTACRQCQAFTGAGGVKARLGITGSPRSNRRRGDVYLFNTIVLLLLMFMRGAPRLRAETLIKARVCRSASRDPTAKVKTALTEPRLVSLQQDEGKAA